MTNKIVVKPEELPVVPEIKSGYERCWMKCPECGMFQYYDYVPYSLSNPIMTAACGHNQFGRKLHEYMIAVEIYDPNKPANMFRDDADHNYNDFVMNSGEYVMSMQRRCETMDAYPTVLSALNMPPITGGSKEAYMEEATGLGIVRGILCAAENAVSKALEDAGLHSVEELSSTQYEDEEIDNEGVIRGKVYMEYVGGQRFVVEVELPMDDYKDDHKLEAFIQHILPGQKEFEIEQYEIHTATYRVKAMSRAQAIVMLMMGKRDGVDLLGTEYVEIATQQGMPRDQFASHEIGEIEAGVGYRISESHMDGIRSVKKV